MISRLLVEAISAASKQRNQMPLPNSPGAPIFPGSDVTTFLHKYEILAAFTVTDPSSSDAVTVFLYYCVEGSNVRDTVVTMHGYVERDWAVLRTEMLDAFRLADSRSWDIIYTQCYLEDLWAKFGGQDDMETLKCFLRTYNHISGVVTERGMMVEYERTEMLLRALPKRLWRNAITKLGLNPLDLRTFDHRKLKDWITSKISAAEAVAMFEFLTPTAAPMTTNATTAPPTSPASIYSINPTALAISPAPTSIASPAPLAPTASTSSTAPTSTSAFPVSSTPATRKAHMTSLAPLVSPAPMASTASTAPLAFAVAEIPTTTPTTEQHTISSGPTVQLVRICVEPPRGPPVSRDRFVQPKHCQGGALPNHHVPDQQHRPQPNSPFNQKPAPPLSHPDTVQPPQQQDFPPCH